MTSYLSLKDIVTHSYEEVHPIVTEPYRYSVFEDYVDFQIFVVRRMRVDQAALGFQSNAFVLRAGEVYKYDVDQDGLEKLRGGMEGLLRMLEGYYHQNYQILNGYSSEIEKLEDFLFSRNVPHYFMDIWFDLKKDLSRIESFYYRNATVYKEFHRKVEHQIQEFSDEFRDIDENIQFHLTQLNTLKGRVESLHHYHKAIKDDRMNKTLLLLTAISGVFLPLNLIVGFFGMNTDGLYFTGDADGTQKVLLLLGVVFVLSLVGIKVVRMADAYILRYFLGRYDFYRSFVSRLGEIDQNLKGK
jgi:magnesium transporter